MPKIKEPDQSEHWISEYVFPLKFYVLAIPAVKFDPKTEGSQRRLFLVVLCEQRISSAYSLVSFRAKLCRWTLKGALAWEPPVKPGGIWPPGELKLAILTRGKVKGYLNLS